MASERPASGFWDMKRQTGGMIDIEFAVQHLQIAYAADGGPLHANTPRALAALEADGLIAAHLAADLQSAWDLQQSLSQLLRVALGPDDDPEAQPKGFRRLVARVGRARDLPALKARLKTLRKSARAAYERVTGAG
jgi:glutamate-ammonia-ligase adenylyltransferase